MSYPYDNRSYYNSNSYANNSNDDTNNYRRRQREFVNNNDNRARSNSRRRNNNNNDRYYEQRSRNNSGNRGRSDQQYSDDEQSDNHQRQRSRGRKQRNRSRSRSSGNALELLTAALSAIAVQPQQRSRGRRRTPQQSRPSSRSSSKPRQQSKQSFMNYEFRDGTAKAVTADQRPLPSTLSTQLLVPGSNGRLEIKFNYPNYPEAYTKAANDPTAVYVERNELRAYLESVVNNIIGAFDYKYNGCVPCPSAHCEQPPGNTTQLLNDFTGGSTDESTLPVGGTEWTNYGT